MKKILLINPSWRQHAYLKTKVKEATLSQPVLSLATIAAPLLPKHKVKILDLDLYENNDILQSVLNEFNPDYVGITGTTPFYNEMINISETIKNFNKNITVIVGGVHANALPDDFINKESVDIIVVGEGDFILNEIISKKIKDVKGVIWKHKNKIIRNPSRPFIEDLDKLPFPALNLFEIDKYKGSHLTGRAHPIAPIETSRGCPNNCVYCNKNIFKRVFRVKSPKRVVDEIEYILSLGYKELHIADDAFSTDIQRAKDICDEIINRNLKFHWSLFNGIRVDRLDLELLKKLKKSGCYQIAFGIESGNQKILDLINKGTTIIQIENAVKMSKEAGIETFGFFMFGLPGETEKTMRDTINFAKKLNLDIAKFVITIPYPGTELYNDLNKKGLIKKKDWSKYFMHSSDSRIFEHPNLKWETIEKYYKKSFREYYLRPAYIYKRLIRSIKKKEVLKDIRAFLKTKW